MKEFKVINIGNNIGGGNTGQLYEAKIEYDGREIDCLAKLVNSIFSKDSIDAHDLMIDVESDYLMKVYGSNTHNGKEYIFMEDLRNFNELYFYLSSIEERIECKFVLDIAICLGNAIASMHKKNYIHGDIHLGNVMFNSINNTTKLIDFDKVKKEFDLSCDCKQYATAIAHVIIFYTKQKEKRPCSGSYMSDMACLNVNEKKIICECRSNIEKVINGSMANFSSNLHTITRIIEESIGNIKDTTSA